MSKGHLLDEDDVRALEAAGHDTVVVAQLDAGDVWEDEAAGRIAAAVRGDDVAIEPPGTGRCNVHALTDGLFTADRAAVEAVNGVDPAITLATLPDAVPVRAGRMVATVKIIPFAVRQASVDAVLERVRKARPFAVRPFRPLRAAIVSTLLPTLKASVVAKTVRTTQARLETLGSTLVATKEAPHEADALAAVLRDLTPVDLVIVFGASAVADPRDVLPEAVRRAGGRIDVVGMPVDPGNLLCFGALGGAPVVCAPGCARSPVENGFDWVLRRVAADLPVTDAWTRSLGVGGLLMDIHSRPTPREPKGSRLAVAVLAAGSSRRMGRDNKLLRPLGGRPLLLHAVEAATGADAGPVHVVTGHEDAAVRAALDGHGVRIVHNPDHALGMSTSLRAAVEAAGRAAGLMVVLGDMPDVAATDMARLAAAFHEHDGERIVAARDRATGRRGNPVVWPRRLFDRLCAIEGDRGARDLLLEREDEVVAVDVEGAALDLDTPEAFAAREGA